MFQFNSSENPSKELNNLNACVLQDVWSAADTRIRRGIDHMSPRRLWSFADDCHGSVTSIAAIAAPAVLGLGLMAMDFATLQRNRTILQGATDSAALAAAGEMKLANSSLQRIGDLVVHQLTAQIGTAPSVITASTGSATDIRASIESGIGRIDLVATVDREQRTLELRLTTQPTTVLSRFAGLSPSTIEAKARARLIGGSSPLCVLALDDKVFGSLRMAGAALITARQCGVQVNSGAKKGGFLADGPGAKLTATRNCAATLPSSPYQTLNFDPLPILCPPLPDPLAGMVSIATPANCDTYLKVKPAKTVVLDLASALPCYRRIEVKQGGTLVLRNSGVLNIGGQNGLLRVRNGGELKMESASAGATLHFTGGSTFAFLAGSKVSLAAPSSGATRGFLFVANPNGVKSRKFFVASVGVTKLLGTVYLPFSTLVVDMDESEAVAATNAAVIASDGAEADDDEGNGPPGPVAGPNPIFNEVNKQAAFTIVVVGQLRVATRSNMILNANYANTSVPVPGGVGPDATAVVLER